MPIWLFGLTHSVDNKKCSHLVYLRTSLPHHFILNKYGQMVMWGWLMVNTFGEFSIQKGIHFINNLVIMARLHRCKLPSKHIVHNCLCHSFISNSPYMSIVVDEGIHIDIIAFFTKSYQWSILYIMGSMLTICRWKIAHFRWKNTWNSIANKYKG
jgi:hypothetical protein